MIPDIKELNFPKKDGKQYATLTHATVSLADMGEKTITTQVKIDGNIVPDFSQGWAVEFQGEKYVMPLREPQGAKENTSLNATVDLTFQHWAIHELKRWFFFSLPAVETGTATPDKWVVPLQMNLGDFCRTFARVLEYWYGDTITLDLNPAWEYKKELTVIDINYSYCWDVLIKLHELYGVRWEIKPNGDSDHYVIRIGYPTVEVGHIFEYGFEGGLLKVERQVQSMEIRNMMLGRGGEKNLPLRYFKDTDPKNKDFRPDPDWVEELKDMVFANLMPATYRSYMQGWKAQHISKYPGYTPVGEAKAYAPWAYRKGYTDAKFDPVEYVKDDESIVKYGPLLGGLDNNEAIYPTIQGTGMDVVVGVEQIASDEIEDTEKNDSVVSRLTFSPIQALAKPGYNTVSRNGGYTSFTVGTGKTGNITGNAAIKASRPNDHLDQSLLIADISYTIRVVNSSTGEEHTASGIPAGSWHFTVDFTFNNTSGETLDVECSFNDIRLEQATLGDSGWKNTFNIWVKNIWETKKLENETPSEYSQRVWKPIFGDREKNEAAVVFTTGMLAHEDYEFKIPKGSWPVYDTDKYYDGERSHWRITLAKSDAELEATGLYVPSTMRQGKPGDTFVFVGTEMTHKYTLQAEIRLDNVKKDVLKEKKDISPTWVITPDKVRLAAGGAANALIHQLKVGCSIRLADKRFIQTEENLYLQSMTYDYTESSLTPDISVVLSNDYETVANPVAAIQSEIDTIRQQIGGSSNLSQAVRAIGDKKYLRKDADDRTRYSLTVGGLTSRDLKTGDISANNIFAQGNISGQDLSMRDIDGRDAVLQHARIGETVTGRLTSEEFASGLLGYGMGIWQDEAGKWRLDIDAITARQSLTVLELLIQKIRAVGGMIVLSQASGKVAEVVETGDGTEGNSWYRLYLDEGEADGDFMAGDFVRCQRWDGSDGSAEKIHGYWVQVTSTGEVDGKGKYIGIARPTQPSGTVPMAGDQLVLMGSKVGGRQGMIVMSTEGGKPRITEWAGIDSPALDAEKMVTCLGDLSGITWQGRALSGYGLMTRNFYGTGEIVLKSGETVEDAFAGLGDRVAAMRQGVRNLVLNSGAWTPDRQITIVPGGSETGLPAHWMPLNDGCAAAVAGGLLVLRKDAATMPDGTAARRNGLHAGVSRDVLPKGTTLTVKVAGEAGNIAEGKSIQVTLYNTSPGWTHSVTLCRVTAADLTKDGGLSIEKSVTLAEEYRVPRLCVSLHGANEGAFIKLANVGLYAGDRAPELWTPAPEDAEERQAEAAAAAKTAADNAQKAADAAKSAADAAAGGVTDLRGYVDEAFRDGIIDAVETAAIAGYINTVNSDRERIAGTYGRLRDNVYLDAAGKAALESAYDDVAGKIDALLKAINDAIADGTITPGESTAVDRAFTAFNTANGAFSAAVETANAAIQSAIEAEAREAADKAAQGVAGGLSSRNLVPMSGLWEAVPGKDDGWGMLNDGCAATVSGHSLSMVKDGDGRNGMWARLTVPSLPKGQKVTIRAKGMVGRRFTAGENEDGTPRRVAITLYNTSPEWTHGVVLADIREAGDFEVARTVELGQGYSAPRLCFSMQGAPEGTGLALDWVALYAGSWAPGGWNPAPEDARRIVTVRDERLTGEFTARADELSQSIESSVTEYRTRFGALRNLLVATRQDDGSIAGTREAFVPSRGHVDYDIPVTLGKGKTYRLDFGGWRDSHEFRGITVSVLRSDGSVLVAAGDIVFEDGEYSLFIAIPASVSGALSGCRLRIEPLDSESEGTLERLKLSEGTVYSEWTPAPEDAETYREETRTLFSVTDGLIRSEVAKTREYAGTAGRNLLMSYREGDTLRTTAAADIGGFVAYPLSVPLTRGGDYTFSIEGWGLATGQRGLSVRLQGKASPHHAICGGTMPLDTEGRNLVTLHVPESGGTFLDDDLISAELQVATLHHPSVVTFSRFQLVAGAYDAVTLPAWSEAPQDTGMLRDMLREETESKIEQTASGITASVEEKVGAVNSALDTLGGKVGTQTSELRSEIVVGTRLISLSVGEKAIPLGTAPYHNLLRHTNQGVTGWTAANSTEGAGAFLIQRQPWDNGADFVKLRRQGAAPSDSSGWEWMRFDGLAPKALSPGVYRLQFHMLAYSLGTFGLTFRLQDTTGTGDNTADNLCPAASVPVPVSDMEDYTSAVFGECKKIQSDFHVMLTVTRDGTLDTGNLRIGTTGRANILELNIGNLRLTKGDGQREWTPSTGDYADGLRRTGIDIANRTINVTADNVTVRNNAGEETAIIDKDGMLRTNMIRANELNVGQVTAGIDGGQRVEVNPESMDIGIFNGKGEQVVAFDGKNYDTVADMLGTGTTETPIAITPTPLRLVGGGGNDHANYPSYDKGHQEAALLAEPFKTDHPCRLAIGGRVSVNGTMPGGDASRPNYTYGTGRMWLVSYSDPGCKNPIGAIELARAANRMVTWGEITKDDPSATNTAFKAPGTVMVPAGRHMIYGEATTQTCDYGQATVIVEVSSLKVSYDYYIGRFFGNGFCIGKASDYLMANFTEAGINFCIRTGTAGFKVDADGAKVWDGYAWRGIKTD